VKPKTSQLQIRVTLTEKAAIQRLARRAGMDMSAYVLGRVLSPLSSRFAEKLEECQDPESASYGLAELNSFLTGLASSELREAVAALPPVKLTPYVANYVAAMVEYACGRCRVAAPAWAREIQPLAEPAFATSLQSLRLHLLTHSPPPFRRRNIFIDSSLGDRV
jgi:hypothetical protein